MQDKLVNYIRDINHKPYGVVVGTKDSNGDLCVGWSLQNPKDKWDRKLGIKIALARATCEDDYALPLSHAKKTAVTWGLLAMWERMNRYYKNDN